MVIGLCVLYALFISWFLFWNLKRRWLLNPSVLWILQQVVFFAGIIPMLDMTYAPDKAHFMVLLGSMVLFVVGNAFAQHKFVVTRRQVAYWRATPVTHLEDDVPSNVVIYTMILISIAVCIIYYRNVGYNVFLDSASAVLSGSNAQGDIRNMRLNSYAGAQYMAAGYVNQFKNTLFPLLIAFLFARGILKRRKFEIILAVCAAPLCISYILGTGQRGPFFLASFIIFVFFTLSLPKKSRRKMNLIVGLGAVLLFGLSTLILGRNTKSIRSVNDTAELGSDMLSRFTKDNQLGAVQAFRYVYYQEPKGLDGEYVRGVQSLIPGHERRRALANLVFKSLFGDYNGTSPASIWGTVWYDFNFLGVIFLALVLGYLYHYVYYVFIHAPKTLGRMVAFSAIYSSLGFWAVGAPDSLANDGAVTMVVLLLFFKLAGVIEGTEKREKRRREAIQAFLARPQIVAVPMPRPNRSLLTHQE